jgi:hypothetical protein
VWVAEWVVVVEKGERERLSSSSRIDSIPARTIDRTGPEWGDGHLE